MVNFGEAWRAQLAKSTLLASTLEPPGSFQIFLRSVQLLKREWGAENNGKLPHLFFPSKTATLVPEFLVEDLPFDRTATLVPAFVVKDTLMMMMTMIREMADTSLAGLCKI